MRWIYLSPHFDDAVLSCGGLIWEQTQKGTQVEIWTINAGDPVDEPGSAMIARVHAMWQTGTPRQTVTQRRLEDQNASQTVGAKLKHFNFIDAIYRRNASGELLYQVDVFGTPHPEDSQLRTEISLWLASEIQPDDMVACPLALGEHVDHAHLRYALEMFHTNIWYYADVPYLFKHSETLPGATSGMQAHHFEISSEGLSHWQSAIAAHKSQISSLFIDEQDMKAQIETYFLQNHGLYLYKRA